MELLNISVNELAEVMHVGRTTASRWKSGSRAVHENSQYYDELIQYFAMRSRKMGGKFLSDFFKSTNIKLTSSCDEELVREYLRLKSAVSIAEELLDKSGDCSYKATVSYFSGVGGRRKAIDTLFHVAEDSASTSEIIILELKQFEWLGSDSDFSSNLFRRISALIGRGCSITFSFNTELDTPSMRNFLANLQFFFMSDKVIIHTINEKNLSALFPCIYAIRGKMLLIGEPNGSTSMHFDEPSIRHNLMLANRFNAMFGESPINSYVNTDNGRLKIVSALTSLTDRKGEVYYIGRLLSSATMSDELLGDILEFNGVPEPEKKICIKLSRALRESLFSKLCSGLQLFYHCNIDELIDAISKESATQYELSSFTNRRISVLREHIVRHIQEVVELILKKRNFKVLLNSDIELTEKVLSVWIKKNAWILICTSSNNQYAMHFNYDVSMVRIASNMYEERIEPYVNDTDKKYIVNELMKIVEKASISD